MLPTYIFLANLVGMIVLLIPVAIALSNNASIILTVGLVAVNIILINTTGPIILIAMTVASKIDNLPEEISKYLTPLYFTIMILLTFSCSLFYLLVAIWLDHREVYNDVNQALVDFYEPVDPENEANPLNQEVKNAISSKDDIPIQAAGITKQFARKDKSLFNALENVSICLYQGENLGLLGPNGAGKSTMFKILSTFHKTSSGCVRSFGELLTPTSDFFKEAGICAQDEILWQNLSVENHLNIICTMNGIPKSVQSQWLRLVDLYNFKKNTPEELSSGMKRKLSFLMSAISNPTFKFLDEATTGMDPMSRKRIRELVESQKKVYGASSILTTHTMAEAERACDRILILVNGKARVLDSVENLKRGVKGFNLTVQKGGKLKTRGEVIAALVGAFEGRIGEEAFVVIEENDAKLAFDLAGIEDLPGAFTALEGLVRDGQIKDFRVSRRSLEDLFLALSKDQEARNDADDQVVGDNVYD